MARQVGRLTDASIRRALKPGIHPDGDRPYLQVRGASTAWIYRCSSAGAATDLSRSPYRGMVRT
jgi:hypothetical protein